MKFYYALFDFLTSSLFARLFGRFWGLRRARIQGFAQTQSLAGQTSTLWFHAASVGELEMLMPIVERALERGTTVSISVFSDSALPWLQKMKDHPRASQLKFVGLSPRERDWGLFWKHYGVQQIWIAQYDLWLGMWAAASELSLEVCVVNARVRPSLIWVKRMAGIFGLDKTFPLKLFARSDEHSLERLFPKAKVLPGMDPRRVQIQARANRANPHADKIKERLKELPKPLGIVGSAWPTDLEVMIEIGPDLATKSHGQGSIAVFPHSFAPDVLRALRENAKQLQEKSGLEVVMIEEKGVLLECYALADWVWVGGGFDHGIHSTLEPAYYGMPLIAGAVNAERFPEVAELVWAKQLTICEDAGCAREWFRHLSWTKSRQIAFPTDAELKSWLDPQLKS